MIIPQAAIRWWNGMSEERRASLYMEYFGPTSNPIQLPDVMLIYEKESKAYLETKN